RSRRDSRRAKPAARTREGARSTMAAARSRPPPAACARMRVPSRFATAGEARALRTAPPRPSRRASMSAAYSWCVLRSFRRRRRGGTHGFRICERRHVELHIVLRLLSRRGLESAKRVERPDRQVVDTQVRHLRVERVEDLRERGRGREELHVYGDLAKGSFV